MASLAASGACITAVWLCVPSALAAGAFSQVVNTYDAIREGGPGAVFTASYWEQTAGNLGSTAVAAVPGWALAGTVAKVPLSGRVFVAGPGTLLTVGLAAAEAAAC